MACKKVFVVNAKYHDSSGEDVCYNFGVFTTLELARKARKNHIQRYRRDEEDNFDNIELEVEVTSRCLNDTSD
jgi:hypothetical protein